MQLHKTAALFFATAAFAQGKPLALAAGGQKTLTIPGLQRIAISDPSIADVRTAGSNELVVVGVTAGHATLIVWTSGVANPERFDLTVTGQGTVASQPPLVEDTTPPPSFSPTLKTGEKITRAAPNLQRLAIGNSAIADVSTENGVTLTGVSPGKTTVLLWFSDGHREQWLVTVVK